MSNTSPQSSTSHGQRRRTVRCSLSGETSQSRSDHSRSPKRRHPARPAQSAASVQAGAVVTGTVISQRARPPACLAISPSAGLPMSSPGSPVTGLPLSPRPSSPSPSSSLPSNAHISPQTSPRGRRAAGLPSRSVAGPAYVDQAVVVAGPSINYVTHPHLLPSPHNLKLLPGQHPRQLSVGQRGRVSNVPIKHCYNCGCPGHHAIECPDLSGGDLQESQQTVYSHPVSDEPAGGSKCDVID